jgi:hypothetical protein
MEGLGNNSKGTFISIIGGKFTQRVKEGTPGAVSRINKNNETVFEMQYDSFNGKLKDIKVVDSSYGKQWNFTLVAGGKDYILTLPYSNGYSKAFLKILPNVNLSEPFKISPSSKEVDGKTQNTVFVNQNNQVVKHYFNKATPNGLPQMVEITVKGQKVWDDTDQMAFLEKTALEAISKVKEVSTIEHPSVMIGEEKHNWPEIDAPETEVALSSEDF